MQKLKLKQKKKAKQKLNLKQKVALHALQKQLQLLKLKEILLLTGFVFGGSLLRIPMQSIPSAEPITFFALLAGWLFGRKKGFLVGASSAYISNFFMFGGQGPWTIFQALGWGIAGFLGGFLREKSTVLETLIVALIATLAFEIVINFGSLFMFPFAIFTLFLTALPFMLTHLVSNSVFALFLPKVRKIINEKGGFSEKKLCTDTINKLRGSINTNRNLPKRKASSV